MKIYQALLPMLRRYRPAFLLIGLAILLAVTNFAGRGMNVAGAAGDVGYRDFSFGFTQAPGGDPNNGPTGEKPQSKLWFNDGSWWGVLYNGSAYHIYSFSTANQSWSDTGVQVDSRRYSHADTLWDGTHLYIATAVQPGTADTDLNARVLRFSYSSATKSYSLDSGFPVVVATVPMEAIVMDKDTTGTLWVTYTYNNGNGGRNVYVAHSNGSDTTWNAPYILPATGATTLTSDDISAIVAFSGQVGVMWSNQTDSTMYWATHTDGAADNVWGQNPALQGPSYADDHINLKSLQADPAGQVFAAVKTSLQDVANQSPNAPQLLLLYLNQNGSWNRRTFGTVAEDHTRPIVLIDTDHRNLYMFATTNNGIPPSSIVYKATSLDNINFASGQGTPFMQSSTDTNINNATSKKGIVNNQTGLLVLGSDVTTGNYWHNLMNLSSTSPLPTATATPIPNSGTNLALNRPATASSLESSSYPASNAVDGNTSTRWSSQFSDPQWIYVDLGQSYAINQVTLMWEAAYAKAYQIQVSSDATNWTTIFSTTTGAGGTENLTGLSGTGRYVRMYGTQRATPYGYSLWEFQVYGSAASAPTSTPTAGPTATSTPTAAPTATGTPTPGPTATATPTPGSTTNLALNRPATASSLESSSYPASNAVDGNTSTRWSSQWSDPQWIYVDLGSSYNIGSVTLMWETAYATAFQIQVSGDATNWTTIYSTTTGTGGTQNLTGLSGTGRYVRMYGTHRATQWGYSLWEFQVYGTAASLPTSTPTATPAALPTSTPTATLAALPTSTPTATPAATSTPTATPAATSTPTPGPTATATPVPTATSTSPAPAPTLTPTPTAKGKKP